jgi:hypothetical protein
VEPFDRLRARVESGKFVMRKVEVGERKEER